MWPPREQTAGGSDGETRTPICEIISTVLGTELPRPGPIYLGQTLNLEHPVSVGDVITVKLTIIKNENHIFEFNCKCINKK